MIERVQGLGALPLQHQQDSSFAIGSILGSWKSEALMWCVQSNLNTCYASAAARRLQLQHSTGMWELLQADPPLSRESCRDCVGYYSNNGESNGKGTGT